MPPSQRSTRVLVGESSLLDRFSSLWFLCISKGRKRRLGSRSHLHSDSHDMAASCQSGKRLQLCCCSCLSVHPYAAWVRLLFRCQGLWQQIMSVYHGSDSGSAKIVFHKTRDAENFWRAGHRCWCSGLLQNKPASSMR